MRINDILTESQLQQLDEGPLGSLAKATGKAIGGVAQGVGAIAGVPGGIKRAFQKGKQAAMTTIGGDEPTAAAPAAQQPAAGGALNAFKAGLQGKTAQEPAAAPATTAAPAAAPVAAQPTAQQVNKAGPAGTAPAQNLQGQAKAAADKTAAATASQNTAQAGQTMYAQVKANIDKLDKKGKQRILALLQKSLAVPAPAAPKAAPVAVPTPVATAPAGGAAIKQMSKPRVKKPAPQPQVASLQNDKPAISESYRSIFVQK